MDDKANKRGFSGISDLTSDTRTARQKEHLWMCFGDSFVHWCWRPGCLGADVHMREFSIAFVRGIKGVDAHGW